MKNVTIYTDGSCLGNPGPGGWAAILELDGTGHRREMSGGYVRTTNNRMELRAVLFALGALKEPCAVELYTDSQYVCHAVEKGWLWGWKKRGWVKADKKPVKNVDLWQRLLQAMAPHDVTFIWVRGHAGNALNERCDKLATTAADSGRLLEDTGFTDTDVD